MGIPDDVKRELNLRIARALRTEDDFSPSSKLDWTETYGDVVITEGFFELPIDGVIEVFNDTEDVEGETKYTYKRLREVKATTSVMKLHHILIHPPNLTDEEMRELPVVFYFNGVPETAAMLVDLGKMMGRFCMFVAISMYGMGKSTKPADLYHPLGTSQPGIFTPPQSTDPLVWAGYRDSEGTPMGAVSPTDPRLDPLKDHGVYFQGWEWEHQARYCLHTLRRYFDFDDITFFMCGQDWGYAVALNIAIMLRDRVAGLFGTDPIMAQGFFVSQIATLTSLANMPEDMFMQQLPAMRALFTEIFLGMVNERNVVWNQGSMRKLLSPHWDVNYATVGLTAAGQRMNHRGMRCLCQMATQLAPGSLAVNAEQSDGLMMDPYFAGVQWHLLECMVGMGWGENDHMMNQHQLGMLTHMMPNAHLHIFEISNTGHFAATESPEKIFNVFLDFVATGSKVRRLKDTAGLGDDNPLINLPPHAHLHQPSIGAFRVQHGAHTLIVQGLRSSHDIAHSIVLSTLRFVRSGEEASTSTIAGFDTGVRFRRTKSAQNARVPVVHKITKKELTSTLDIQAAFSQHGDYTSTVIRATMRGSKAIPTYLAALQENQNLIASTIASIARKPLLVNPLAEALHEHIQFAAMAIVATANGSASDSPEMVVAVENLHKNTKRVAELLGSINPSVLSVKGAETEFRRHVQYVLQLTGQALLYTQMGEDEDEVEKYLEIYRDYMKQLQTIARFIGRAIFE